MASLPPPRGDDRGDGRQGIPASSSIDVRSVQETMRGGKATYAWLASWVPGTLTSPLLFREALHAQVAARRGASLKSSGGTTYDIYHDVVVAHLNKSRVAMIARDGMEWQRVSFDALHARCNALAAAWEELGLAPGQTVCVIAPLGVEWLAACLTAIRLGVVLTILPPGGPTYLKDRLALLKPDRIATPERFRRTMGPYGATALPLSAPPRLSYPRPSRAFAPDEVIAKLVSPFAPLEDCVVDVIAGDFLEDLVRTAGLTFALDPSDVVAAPGFSVPQFQPTLMFATLLAGAAWCELAPTDIDNEPRALNEHKVTVLGVDRKTRERLFRQSLEPLRPSVRLVFRSLTETLDIDRWDAFGRMTAERHVAAMTLVHNAATGGTLLFGLPTQLTVDLRVTPMPGVPFQLSEYAGGALPALNDTGIYSPLREEEPSLLAPRCVLGKLADAHVYAGVADLGPDAESYPVDEVEALLETQPAVRHAAALVLGGRWLNEAKVVLVVFVDAPDAAVSAPILRDLISRELGDRYLPERIEIYPLKPRLLEGKVDRPYCKSQYMSGVFREKARSELFLLLSRIGYIFAPPRPVPLP